MHTQEDWRARGIIPALIVIGIGVLLMLRNLDIIIIRDLWRYWPVILIALGLVKLVDARDTGNQVTGGVMIGAGALFLANTLALVRLSWNEFWPLLLIGAGILMLYTRLMPPRPVNTSAFMEGSLSEYAVFGGVSRKVTTDDFRGGYASAMFGGIDIDLRRAAMRQDAATIDVSAIFGGVEFKVPQNWIVMTQVAAIFGGVDNKCVQPDADMPGVKRLYVRGSAIFGGMEFKN